jgi:hypothetical protein
MNNSKLKVKAVLICDNVITEKDTGKNSLIGIFENINAKQFPATHPRLYVYVTFTEALGKYNFRLELVNIENNQLAYPGSEILGVESSDIAAHCNLVFGINSLRLEQPGKYEFRLFVNGEICETRSMNVNKV